MNQTIDNLTTLETIKTIQEDIINSFNTFNITTEIILIIFLIIFSYLIYKNADKIYNFSGYEPIKYFKFTFLFLLIMNLISFIMLIFQIIFYKIEIITENFATIIISTFSVTIILYLISFGLATTYLINSILYKFFQKKLLNKFSKRLFFIFILILVIIHFILYSITFLFEQEITLIYLIITYSILIGYIYFKTKSKKIFLQPHYLGLLLLIILSLVSNVFDFIIYNTNYKINYPQIEYIIDSFTVLVYALILSKLQKWTKKLI